MEVDEALDRLGTCSRSKVIFYLILCITTEFAVSWNMMAIVFIGGRPEHYCKVETNETTESSIIPIEDGRRSSCLVYVDGNMTSQCSKTTNEWVYTGDIANNSIVAQWDLVCERSYLVQMSQTILTIGVMFGCIVFSTTSDYFGRKPIFLISQWCLVVVGIVTIFIDNYCAFAFMRFLTGALLQGLMFAGFILACEMFPARHRTFAGIVINLFWAFGMCILALLAFFIRDWRYLQLTVSLFGVFTIPLYWFLPESVPWLVANNRHQEANEVIRRAAKMNKIVMPEHILISAPLMERDVQLLEDAKAEESNLEFEKSVLKPTKGHKKDDKINTRYTLLDVVCHRTLLLYAVIMCTLWFVNTLVYYGLSLSTDQLAGNRYLNFFFSGLVEIPAYLVSYFTLERWGRRWSLIVFHAIAGISLVLTQFIPGTTASGVNLLPLVTTLNMIGKFGITGSFAVVYLYAPEIFPTTLRNQTMGITSLGGRLGNMLSPFVPLLGEKVPWLPGPLFGTLSIGGGLLALFLPETLNRPLPQTIEDIENWTKKVSCERDFETDDTPKAA